MSTSNNYLVSHATRNVWSTPDPYRQAIYAPARLSPPGGVWRTIDMYWNELALPDAVDNYHVYQLGHQHATLSAQAAEYAGQWIKLTDICSKSGVVIVVYNDDGICIPRHLCYFYIGNDASVMMAVSIPESGVIKGLNLDTDVINVRFYTNTSMTSLTSDTVVADSVVAGGSRPTTNAAIMSIQNNARALLTARGRGDISFTVNGRYHDVLTLSAVKPGDYVDWIYVATVEKIIDFKISELATFQSVLDKVNKLLISHDEAVQCIEHHDDIDIYIVTKNASSTSGVLVHKSKEAGVRMVTHRDYSIAEKILAAVLTKNNIARAQAYLRFVYHTNGRSRPLVYESNRIHELYKLPFAKRYAAMAGNAGAPDFWTAPLLEQSKYVSIMSARSGKITREMVTDAYGYNSLSTIIAGTPSRVQRSTSIRHVMIPIGLQAICTGYEYDADGKLCGVSVARNTSIYSCISDRAEWVELIFGEGGVSADYIYNSTSGVYHDEYNYRFYERVGDRWYDITGTKLYTARNNVWTLASTVDPETVVAVSNAQHIFGSRQIEIDGGLLSFAITTRVNRVDIEMPIPAAQVDVFLNEHPLVEGVDYFIQWPRVYITNREYINQDSKTQNVNWRCTGFCDPQTMAPTPASDTGFVINGKLSNNARFDLHDDRVLSIVCAGAMYDRSEVIFAENSSEVHVPDAREGYPYAIKDILTTLNNFIIASNAPDDSTDVLLKKSKVIDQKVITYMNAKFPMTQAGIAQLGEKRYTIFSPFFSRIISDLSTSILGDPAIESGNYTEAGLRRIVEQYTELLDVDPVHMGTNAVKECAIIAPHCYTTPVAITSRQKNFLDTVVEIYGGGLISLQGSVTIK